MDTEAGEVTPIRSDLDALAAAVAATPEDLGAWQPYIDCCLEQGREDWAELAREYLAADEDRRVELMVWHGDTWPVAAAMYADATAPAYKQAADAIERARGLVVAAWQRFGETLRRRHERRTVACTGSTSITGIRPWECGWSNQ